MYSTTLFAIEVLIISTVNRKPIHSFRSFYIKDSLTIVVRFKRCFNRRSNSLTNRNNKVSLEITLETEFTSKSLSSICLESNCYGSKIIIGVSETSRGNSNPLWCLYCPVCSSLNCEAYRTAHCRSFNTVVADWLKFIRIKYGDSLVNMLLCSLLNSYCDRVNALSSDGECSLTSLLNIILKNRNLNLYGLGSLVLLGNIACRID